MQTFSFLRCLLFGIPLHEATFTRRGFYGRATARNRLEEIGFTFLRGYNAALQCGEPEKTCRVLQDVTPELRGFAFEGAAMALTLLDRLTPWRRTRLRLLLEGPGSGHQYMIHVGMGWALARLRGNPARFLERLDPLLGWLAVDGYGFHEGYFHWRATILRQVRPARLCGYACRAWDQGLGRSLWFVTGAEISTLVALVSAFSIPRQSDLWSGIGLACAYAGGIEPEAIHRLKGAAGACLPQLAQGAAFAAKARELAGNPAPHTDDACRILCDMPAKSAAAVTDTALEELQKDLEPPVYEAWRRQVQQAFTSGHHSAGGQT